MSEPKPFCSTRACALKGRLARGNRPSLKGRDDSHLCGYCYRVKLFKVFLCNPELFCAKPKCRLKLRRAAYDSPFCGTCVRAAEKCAQAAGGSWADIVRGGPAPGQVLITCKREQPTSITLPSEEDPKTAA